MQDRKLEYGTLDRNTSHPRFRRAELSRCRCRPYVPSACLMPIHAMVAAAVLLAGLLPLYFFSLRSVTKANNQLTILCGLYPTYGGHYNIKNWTTGPYPPAPPIPPAPPGAGNVQDPDECQQDFEFFANKKEHENSPWRGAALITFLLTVEDVDPRSLTATIRILAYLGAPLAGPVGLIRLPDDIILHISINSGPPDLYRSGDGFISWTPKKADNVPASAQPGLSHYPFDEYLFKVSMFICFVNITTGRSSYVPFVAIMEKRNPSFSFNAPVENSYIAVVAEGSSFSYQVTVRRTTFAKAFSLFIFVSMWALTLYCVVHAVKLYFSRDEPLGIEVPTFAATLLFALPAVREVQPGVPDVGAIIDIVGFFWNMVLLVVVCLLLLAKIYGNKRRAEMGGPEHNKVTDGSAAGMGMTAMRDRSDIAERFVEV